MIRRLEDWPPVHVRECVPVPYDATIFCVDLPGDPAAAYFAWRMGETRFDEAGQFYETELSLERVV